MSFPPLAENSETTDPVVVRPIESLRLDPRYEVVETLGAGGMASVWRARDRRLGREVALKVLHRDLPFSESMRERFEREARLAAGLAHENVVQVYDFGVDPDHDRFIAMELVEGRSLRSILDVMGKLPSQATLLIAYEIARGLGYAHARGVVHRDVKPDNVLLSERGAVKVADFGIALQDELVRLTASGVPVGTPAFLAPEQVKGEAADARSDVFSFGVLLYECCTGRLPFDGKTSSAILYKIVEGQYAAPETYAPVDGELSQVIRRCLQRDPAARFRHAGEVEEAIRPLLQRRGIVDPRATLAAYVLEGNLARPVTSHPHVPRAPLRRRLALAAGGVAALAMVAASGVMIARALNSTPRPPALAAPAVAEGAVVTRTVPPDPAAALPANPPLDAPPAAAAAMAPEAAPPPPPPPRKRTRPVTRRETPVEPPAAPTITPAPPVAQAPGILHIVPVGAWADILIDGKPRGRSPPLTRVELPPGEHVVELRNPLRAPWRQNVTITPGATQSIRAQLQPLP